MKTKKTTKKAAPKKKAAAKKPLPFKHGYLTYKPENDPTNKPPTNIDSDGISKKENKK